MWISRIIYRLFIELYHGVIAWVSPFNHKARLFTQGRCTQTIQQFKEKTIWFHCASLGEFEQAKPLIEWCHKELSYPIVITFFSPSGYEYKVNFPLAQAVYYLPKDTPKNARSFIEAINPHAAFFIKYEFWYYHLKELNERKIPHFLIAGIFRESQVFFKTYGKLHQSMLHSFTHCFVQDEASLQLLHSNQFLNSSLAYDTRFDAVYKRSTTHFKDELIEAFIGRNKVLVVGSSWPKDEKIIAKIASKYQELKIIIAPHDVNTSRIKEISQTFPDAVLYSSGSIQASNQVLVIDQIGMLAMLYRYASFCWIGGGFNTSVHNVLEAAVYGKALLYGPNHHKSKEALDLVELKAAQCISKETEAIHAMEKLLTGNQAEDAGKISAKYVENRLGGTTTITSFLVEKNFI